MTNASASDRKPEERRGEGLSFASQTTLKAFLVNEMGL